MPKTTKKMPRPREVLRQKQKQMQGAARRKRMEKNLERDKFYHPLGSSKRSV